MNTSVPETLATCVYPTGFAIPSGFKKVVGIYLSSNRKDQFAGRRPAFEIAMRLRSIGEGIHFADAQDQLALSHPVKNVAGAPFQVLALRNVVKHRRPG